MCWQIEISIIKQKNLDISQDEIKSFETDLFKFYMKSKMLYNLNDGHCLCNYFIENKALDNQVLSIIKKLNNQEQLKRIELSIVWNEAIVPQPEIKIDISDFLKLNANKLMSTNTNYKIYDKNRTYY